VRENINNRFFNLFFTEPITLDVFFFGNNNKGTSLATLLNVVFGVYRHCIWVKKLTNNLPNFDTVIDDFRYKMGIIEKCAKWIPVEINKFDMFRKHGRG